MAAIKSSKQCGIPTLHIEALKQAAATNNTPIAIRPINPLAEYYIAEGCPTKGYKIKIKTADRGIASGLIPISPKFSRLVHYNKNDQHEFYSLLQSLHIGVAAPITKQQFEQLTANPKISFVYDDDFGVEFLLKKDNDQQVSFYAKWNKDTKHYEFTDSDDAQNIRALEKSMNDDPNLTTKALIVTKERLSVLKTLLGEQFQMIPGESENDYILSWKRGDELIQAYAVWNEANSHYDIIDEHKEPLLVLAKKINPGDIRYITTDYDLLVICPNYKSFEPGGRDRTPFRTQGADPAKNQLDVNKSHEEGYSGQQEDENRGNISPRTADTIALINKIIGKKDPIRVHSGLETVHHNAEFHNPFASDPEKNVPSLMVFPKPFDLSTIAHQLKIPDLNQLKHVSEILIETIEEMTLIRELLYTQGYYWPSHARYNHLMGPFNAEKIEAAQDAIQKMQGMRAELIVVRNPPKEPLIEEQDGQKEQSLTRIAGSK